MNYSLLMINDLEPALAQKIYFEEAGFFVDVVSDGLSALELLATEQYDIVLIEKNLSTDNGIHILSEIRKKWDMPVIMMASEATEEEQIKCYDLLADDFFIHPDRMKLLLKRIQAVLRRVKKKKSMLFIGEISLNLKSNEVFFKDEKVILTKKEFDLLKLFMQYPNQVFERDELLMQCWGDKYTSDYLVNVQISNLRKKLGNDYIITVKRMGYKMVDGSRDHAKEQVI